MKIRNGFVSNSSSSSFIIFLHKITDEQKQMIYNHIAIGQEIDKKLKEQGKEPIYEYYEDWNIKEDDFSLWCSTSMDNFDLQGFIEREVKCSDIQHIGDEPYFYVLYDDEKYIKMRSDYLRGKKLRKIKDKLNEN